MLKMSQDIKPIKDTLGAGLSKSDKNRSIFN